MAVPCQLWWEKHQGKLTRFDNLTIIDLPTDDTESLAERGMNLQCTQSRDGTVNIGNDDTLVSVTPCRSTLSKIHAGVYQNDPVYVKVNFSRY